MRTKYKQWAIDYLNKEAKSVLHFNWNMVDPEPLIEFVKSRPTYLEIGTGKGKFIIEMAKKYPEFNFVGVEINRTIAGMCCKAIDRAGLTNVKIVPCDFYVFMYIKEPLYFDGIFLNFSDPWPKKRHESRRLTHPTYLYYYYKFLEVGSKIYFKSDNANLYEFSKEKFNDYKRKIIKDIENYEELDDFDVRTEFETKYIKEGRIIKRIVAEKTNETIQNLNEEDLEGIKEPHYVEKNVRDVL